MKRVPGLVPKLTIPANTMLLLDGHICKGANFPCLSQVSHYISGVKYVMNMENSSPCSCVLPMCGCWLQYVHEWCNSMVSVCVQSCSSQSVLVSCELVE